MAAGIEPLQIVGVLVAMPAVAHVSDRDPGFLLRFVAVVGVLDAALLVVLAGAPHVAVAIAVHAVVAGSIGTLAPAFLALVSLVSPPRVRSAAFSTMSVFAIPGVALVLPVLGAISDSFGMQASVLALVPVAVVAGLVLASAARSVADDITAVQIDSARRAAQDPGHVPPAAPRSAAVEVG